MIIREYTAVVPCDDGDITVYLYKTPIGGGYASRKGEKQGLYYPARDVFVEYGYDRSGDLFYYDAGTSFLDAENVDSEERYKCQHCGQWGDRHSACNHCGAPID